MTKDRKRKKKIILIIVFSLLVLIAAALAFLFSGVNSFLKPSIKNAIAKIIVDGSDSLYSFSLKDYAIGPGGKTVVLKDLQIRVDSNHYYRLKKEGQLPPLVFSLNIGKASVTGLHPIDLYKHKKIICRTIGVEDAVVNFLQQKIKDSVDKPQKSLYELIQPDLQLIQIEKLAVKNAEIEFKTVEQQSNRKQSWHIEKASLVFDDILVDSTSFADTSRAWYASNIQATLSKFFVKETGGMYNFTIAKTEYDFKNKTAKFDSLKILPAISNAEFNRRVGHELDQFTIIVPSMLIRQVNAASFLAQNFIEAGTIDLSNPVIKLYKDKNAPENKINKVGKYPHQLLLKAETRINIKQINIKGGSLTVTQKSDKTQLDGSFTFRGIRGDIKNISNLSATIARNRWCKAELTAGFMGNNQMYALFSFDLASTDNGHFVVDASLQSLQAEDLNKMTRALAQAELQSFTLDKMRYHVEGYDHYAIADLQLLYHDLKMSALKREEDGGFKKKGLMSLLANVLKLYNDNPQNGKERKATNIRDQRIPNKNFFGLITHALLACAQEIAIKGDNKTLPGVGGNNKKKDRKN